MFDGNGNWRSDFSAISDRDNNIKILASRFDNILLADIKESFENCLTKDGQIAPIGAFNMGGQKVTNLANGTNSNDAVNRSQLDELATTITTTISNEVVKLSGAQTIADVKTFTSSPVVPTPAVGDNSTKVASTAFIKSVLASSGAGMATISKSGNGYCRFNNGLIIQWGKSPNGVGSSPTVTTPTSFSSASSWQVVTTAQGTSAGVNWYCQANITSANTFTINKDGDGRAVYWHAIGY